MWKNKENCRRMLIPPILLSGIVETCVSEWSKKAGDPGVTAVPNMLERLRSHGMIALLLVLLAGTMPLDAQDSEQKNAKQFDSATIEVVAGGGTAVLPSSRPSGSL